MSWQQVFDLEGFDPESIDTLTQAIDDAMAKLKQSAEFDIEDEDACRFAIARYVVDAARGGERNATKLAQEALFKFRL